MNNEQQIQVLKENDVWLRIITNEPNIKEELSEHFEIEIPNAQYSPAYRKRAWDGKIRLFHKKTGRIYVGLLSELRKFFKDSGYQYVLDKSLKEYIDQSEYDDYEFDTFIESLDLPYTPYDYQINAFQSIINGKRRIILSPTGSGKSLVIYLVIRFLLQEGFYPIILIVPTIGLTTQMHNDFQDYSKNNGWNTEESVHVIAEGSERHTKKPVSISTWQSVYNLPKEYFQNYSSVIIDECFDGKSLVKTINGYKRIDNISQGDIIFSYNNEMNRFEYDEVTDIHMNLTKSSKEDMIRLFLENGEQIDVTANHKFLTKNRGWVRADEIHENDDVINT